MATMMKRTVAISFIAVVFLVRLSGAVNHTVGSPGGSWDTSTDMKAWASSNTFVVGDNLIFQYTTNHDVTEVPKADYDSCTAANPIGSFRGGLTTIPLASPGTRYFICTTAGHCNQGMKLEIDTVAATPSPPPKTPATPPPPEKSPATPPPASNTTAPPTQAPPSPNSSPVAPAPNDSAKKGTFGIMAGIFAGIMTFLAF